MRKALNNIIVKPVSAVCNLNCDYCFYLEKGKLYPGNKVMSEETLEELISQMSDQTGKEYSITWQGGEPCMAGLDFFQKAIDLQIQSGKKNPKLIGNSLQTNGTLLNDDWIAFLKKYNFLVGYSLDGPKSYHDAYRTYNNGKGSWEDVVSNGRKLLKAGVEVNILSCITDNSAYYADELYHFYKTEGYQWLQFNPISEWDNDQLKSASVDPKKYGKFLCRMFDLWFNDFANNRPAPVIRFIENTFHAYLGFRIPECSFQENCGVYLLVEHNGDVFSCDFFVEPGQKLGNIHNDRLFDMLNSPVQYDFGKAKTDLATECYSCKWRDLCYGGCPKYRSNSGHNYFCEAYKAFFAYSEERFKHLAKLWKSNNQNKESGTFDASGYFK